MKRPANVCGRLLPLLLLICLVATGRASAAQEARSSAPEAQAGSLTLSAEELREQTRINEECAGVADELVLTRRERDVEREGRAEAIEAAKLYRTAAEDYKASAEAERTRGDGYKDAYETEVRKGKWRTVKVTVVAVLVGLGLGLVAR